MIGWGRGGSQGRHLERLPAGPGKASLPVIREEGGEFDSSPLTSFTFQHFNHNKNKLTMAAGATGQAGLAASSPPAPTPTGWSPDHWLGRDHRHWLPDRGDPPRPRPG